MIFQTCAVQRLLAVYTILLLNPFNFKFWAVPANICQVRRLGAQHVSTVDGITNGWCVPAAQTVLLLEAIATMNSTIHRRAAQKPSVASSECSACTTFCPARSKLGSCTLAASRALTAWRRAWINTPTCTTQPQTISQSDATMPAFGVVATQHCLKAILSTS